MVWTNKRIYTPLSSKIIKKLKAGDNVFLNGIIYTARDQAHKRLVATIKMGKKLPFILEGQVIFYCGPTPAPEGKTIGTSTSLSANGEQSRTIGSCGPTTSSRMDKFTPPLLKNRLKGMIGKGSRSKEVIQAIKEYKAVYFLAPAGAGAYLSKCVKKTKVVAYPGLGPEAIYKLEVNNFPLIVGIDSSGNNIYSERGL